MENKVRMLKKVGLLSIGITVVVMLLSLLFWDKSVAIGIGLGCMIGLIGFNMIVQWGFRVQETGSMRSAFFSYMLRYFFYGCMFVLSYYMGANLLGILAGFICHKVSVYIYSIRDGGGDNLYETFDGIVIHLAGFELAIHTSVLVWLGICLAAGIMLVAAGRKFKKADVSKAPGGMVLVFEQIVGLLTFIVGNSLGKNTRKYLWFYGTCMILMLMSNLSGLLGVQPPTSNLSVNVTLALTMWLIIQTTSLRKRVLWEKSKAGVNRFGRYFH